MVENGDHSALIDNSSEIIVVSNLNKTYSSEGVPTLKVASKIEFPLQSHKVQEAKMADQKLLKTVENCLFQCVGAVALPLPPFRDALSYL